VKTYRQVEVGASKHFIRNLLVREDRGKLSYSVRYCARASLFGR
jgi:hypothetical protein